MALPFFPLVYGQVLTAGQWNALFNAKQDLLGYTPLNRAGGTMLGRLITAPSTVQMAGLQIPEGTAPASPNDGDVWATAAGLFIRIEGVTYQIGGSSVTNTAFLSKAVDYTVTGADVASGKLIILASGTITLTVPPALGAAGSGPTVTILNVGSGLISMSNDGTTIIDQIATPAGANGQVGGYRNVVPNGTTSYCYGQG